MIKHIGSLRSKQKELENITIFFLFEITMDMVGPLPKIALVNKYVLLAINQYFKWCKAKLLSNHIAFINIKFLESKAIYQYGVPKFLFIDNGRNGMQNLRRYAKHMALFINIQCLNGQIGFEILIYDFSCKCF